MSKNEDLSKHTLNLCRGDYEKLQMLFPDTGAGPIIRQLVRDFIIRTEMIEASAPEVEVTL